MTVNELRIGNWINIQGNFKKVLGIDYIHKEHLIISDGYYQLDWCEPIPLTEEILLKCGFEKHITIDIYPTFVFRMININDGIVYVSDLGFLNHIKHLHQIQNLYFALTGEELNIEL